MLIDRDLSGAIVFFFQAEDGIRDKLVTGVQTCALPISGNVYVTAAKRVLQGVVGIDGENGPTEIAIIADHTADPRFVAADLIGQAEHDENAGCLLITTDPALPDKVDEELARQIPLTKHKERVQTALRGQAGYVLADDI